jgi:Uma2 family endonuclease
VLKTLKIPECWRMGIAFKYHTRKQQKPGISEIPGFLGLCQDECYGIGEAKNIPDLAIEVTVTSGSIDKLEIYRRLGVSEVWFWESSRLKLYHKREEKPSKFLESNGYEQINTSELLSAA